MGTAAAKTLACAVFSSWSALFILKENTQSKRMIECLRYRTKASVCVMAASLSISDGEGRGEVTSSQPAPYLFSPILQYLLGSTQRCTEQKIRSRQPWKAASEAAEDLSTTRH